MTKKLTLISTIVVLAVSVDGCYYDNAEDLYGAVPCIFVDVTYNADVKSIVDASCATSGCHVNGTGRVPLTTFEEVKDAVANKDLTNRVVSKAMPKGTSLTPCDYDKFVHWLNNDTPEK